MTGSDSEWVPSTGNLWYCYLSQYQTTSKLQDKLSASSSPSVSQSKQACASHFHRSWMTASRGWCSTWALHLVPVCVFTDMSHGWKGETFKSVGFTRIKCSVAICSICKTVVTSKEGKTSNVMKHLKTKPQKSKWCAVLDRTVQAASKSLKICPCLPRQVKIILVMWWNCACNKNKPLVVNWRHNGSVSTSNLKAQRWRTHYLPH